MHEPSTGETASTPNRRPSRGASKGLVGRPDLTPQDAAECLGLTPRGLRQWRRRNYGPAYYRGLGKQILYRQSDLDSFIESRRVEPEVESQ